MSDLKRTLMLPLLSNANWNVLSSADVWPPKLRTPSHVMYITLPTSSNLTSPLPGCVGLKSWW